MWCPWANLTYLQAMVNGAIAGRSNNVAAHWCGRTYDDRAEERHPSFRITFM
jgi:hypothetical protein